MMCVGLPVASRVYQTLYSACSASTMAAPMLSVLTATVAQVGWRGNKVYPLHLFVGLGWLQGAIGPCEECLAVGCASSCLTCDVHHFSVCAQRTIIYMLSLASKTDCLP